MRKSSFHREWRKKQKLKHKFQIHTSSISKSFLRACCCKSAIAIFVWRVTWNYAYSPFKSILPHSLNPAVLVHFFFPPTLYQQKCNLSLCLCYLKGWFEKWRLPLNNSLLLSTFVLHQTHLLGVETLSHPDQTSSNIIHWHTLVKENKPVQD